MSDSASLSQPPNLTSDVFKAMLEKSSLRIEQIVMLGVLAGIYIGFGGLFATVALAGSDGVLPYGLAQLLAGLVFTTGLVLVVIAGAELFTGNLLMAGPVAARNLTLSKAAIALLVVYLANFAGSLLLAALVFSAGLHLAGDGAVAKAALNIASTKTSHGFVAALASGVLANILVCLAVWLSYSATSTTDKVAAVILPIAAFVAAGFEHSIANMYLLPYAGMIQGAVPDSTAGISVASIAGNLIPATLGNVIGGSSVALAYWWSYCRERQ